MEKLTREERKAATREALIRAGCDVVRARGFSASVDEIANAAGFTKGAVYSNFEGRVELIHAIAERVLFESQVTLDENAVSLETALQSDARRLAQAIDAEPEKIVLLFDFFVTSMRDPALHSAMRRKLANRSEGTRWPEGLTPPIDGRSFWLVVNALGAGLALHRLMFGADDVPEELFAWAYGQIARTDGDPQPAKRRRR